MLTLFARALLPFHMAAIQRISYALPRFVFHACLIVVPFWYSGHLFLWNQYGIEWSLGAIPDAWIDGLTLLILGFLIHFLTRRVTFKGIRSNTTISDYLLITMTALPFLTGYLLSRGSLAYIPFFYDHLENIHALTAEAMILMVTFLFCRVRLMTNHCTGCAACELTCPTEALAAEAYGRERIFTYSPYLCICCGSCMNTCPEYAVELRHSMSFSGYYRMLLRQTIQSVKIMACERCGAFFAPEPQIDKIRQTIEEDYIYLCLRCKREVTARNSLPA